MIENYLRTVTVKKEKRVEVSSLVERLTGVVDLSEDNHRKDYTDFLSEKYK